MFDSEALMNELQTLKDDLSRLVQTSSDGFLDASKGRAEALAEQVKAALNEFGETLEQEEDHVEKLISEHPIASVVSALALGVVIGFTLRRLK
jgi:ElaB/YqjD/DUF883 family membrane-anchored ribosome-binding protein